MDYKLSSFSRSYLDQKIADMLEYLENNKTKLSSKPSHAISIEMNGCNLWGKCRNRSGYKTPLLTESSKNLRVCVRVHQLVYLVFTGYCQQENEFTHICNNKS